MELYRDYPCNPDNYQRGRAQPVLYLVVHYVGATGGARNNAKYYHGTAGINASAHYFVGHGPEAEVWTSVPEGDTAWHVGAKRYVHPRCRNANSIGVEMCCHQDAAGRWYLDPETVDRAVELCRDIMARYGIDTDHVLRHYDVTGKLCPRPWVDDPAAWEDFKRRLEEEDLTQEQFNEKMAVYLAGEREKPVSPWAAGSWEKAVGKGVFDGSAPQGSITREQAAVVLDRLGLLE